MHQRECHCTVPPFPNLIESELSQKFYITHVYKTVGIFLQLKGCSYGAGLARLNQDDSFNKAIIMALVNIQNENDILQMN
jgi:hypothetical protein